WSSAAPPRAAWREHVVSDDMEQRRDTIAPGDLLPFGVRAAAVGDGQLPDAGARLRQPCRELDLDPEALCPERQALEEVGPDELVARLHVREVQVGEHVGDEREEVVADGVPEEQHAMKGSLEAGAVHGVALAVPDRPKQGGPPGWVVLEAGV